MTDANLPLFALSPGKRENRPLRYEEIQVGALQRLLLLLSFFDGSRNPMELLAIVAGQLYLRAEMLACLYEVRFDRKEFAKRKRRLGYSTSKAPS